MLVQLIVMTASALSAAADSGMSNLLSPHPCDKMSSARTVSQRFFRVENYGAVADGRTKCTAAFAAAVSACAKDGGGRVVVSAGTWFTGPIHLKSNVELYLEKDAKVLFSDDPNDCLPPVMSSWEGLECLNYSPFVYAYCCTNVAITGEGVLRAKMDFWNRQMKEEGKVWDQRHEDPRYDIQGARAILYKWGSEDYPVEKRDMPAAHPVVLRPQLIQFNRCKGVRMEGVRVEDSPFWTIHLFMSEDVVIRGVDVCAHGFNNDGVDVEMSRNVIIEDSTFDQGDDGIVLKAGRNRDAWRTACPTANVEVRNCHFKVASSLAGVGSELSGGVENVYVHDCTADVVQRLFFVKTNHRRGGFVRNIRMERIRAKRLLKVMSLECDVLYQWKVFPDHETRLTEIDGLALRDVTCDEARFGFDLRGDARQPAKNVTIGKVRIGRLQERQIRVENVENLKLDDVWAGKIGSVEDPVRLPDAWQ